MDRESPGLREARGRIGDPRSARELQTEFPAVRVRQAGRTGGETPAFDITADDLSPETLLDDDASRTPAAVQRRMPLDTLLSRTDASAIGGGTGKDEAELAREQPISPEEHERLQRRVARSGGSLRNVEPHETRAGSPGRVRQGSARRRRT